MTYTSFFLRILLEEDRICLALGRDWLKSQIMPVCCVHSCLFPGKRFTRFPVRNEILFKKWLEKINNPQLFLLSPAHIYRCHRVCERHFEKEQLNEETYYGCNKRLLVPEACPTLFLNEVIVRKKRQDIAPIRWDHTYSRTEVNEQDVKSVPSTAVEICVTAES